MIGILGSIFLIYIFVLIFSYLMGDGLSDEKKE